MPELPEIASRAREMQVELVGKKISSTEFKQPKCLNLPSGEFASALKNRKIVNSSNRGKWILLQLDKGWLCLNMGMGGEAILCDHNHLPIKYSTVINFSDSTCLAFHFWWFGYVHFSAEDPRISHPMISKLGPNILDVNLEDFQSAFAASRKNLKAVLLDQKVFAGLGNAYVHDILFFAKLHPLRQSSSLSTLETEKLFHAVHLGLQPSLEKGGAFYEKDLFGKPGRFTQDQIVIGYREGTPCPVCGTLITKIKTGSTSSFICQHCQI